LKGLFIPPKIFSIEISKIIKAKPVVITIISEDFTCAKCEGKVDKSDFIECLECQTYNHSVHM